MHNNFTLDKTPRPPKPFYTAAEAAVSWARSEGANGANDPRIAYYTGVIMQAITDGDLGISNSENTTPTIALADLKEWFERKYPDSRPKFLFGK